jgi:hypothetical protein
MKPFCETIQQQIPQALLNDLPAQEKERLKSHLAECPDCRREAELYRQTISQLNPELNGPVPKHFFVTVPELDSRWKPWLSLGFMRNRWVLAAVSLLLTITGLVLAKTRVEINPGGVVVAFGQNRPATGETNYIQQSDLQKLRQELTHWLDQKSAAERQEFVRLLKSELVQGKQTLSPAQEKWVLASLGKVENRLNQQILTTGTLLQAHNEQVVARLSDSLTKQRDQDLSLIDASFRSLARRDAMKNEQTDAILDTLIQVAELKMTPEASNINGREQK